MFTFFTVIPKLMILFYVAMLLKCYCWWQNVSAADIVMSCEFMDCREPFPQFYTNCYQIHHS